MAERPAAWWRMFWIAVLGSCCALALAGCGNTLQSQPLTSEALEPLVMAQHYPVYWVGARFQGMRISSASGDPSGAYTVQYGGCVTGGPESCVPPLQLISSPDNSFLPGAAGAAQTRVRGVRALLADRGAVVEIATGPAVVDVRAATARLALAAAAEMVPINELGQPGAPLPAAQPNTGFASKALEGQRLQLLRGLTPTSR